MLTFKVTEVKRCSVLEVVGLVVFVATYLSLLSWHLRLLKFLKFCSMHLPVVKMLPVSVIKSYFFILAKIF
jgi:hypothetical protein